MFIKSRIPLIPNFSFQDIAMTTTFRIYISFSPHYVPLLCSISAFVNKLLWYAKLGNEKEMIQRCISAADAEIDRLVYELYRLTEEEIAIVEKKSG